MNSHRFFKNNEEKIKGDFIINHFNLDEKCLGVFDLNMGENSPCMILHYDECWYRSGHECPDLPDEIEMQTDGVQFVFNQTPVFLEHKVSDINSQ